MKKVYYIFAHDAGFSGFVDAFPGANIAISTARRLKASATFAFRLENDAGNSFLDVGFVGGLVDTAAAQAFNPGGDTRVKTLYNQADPTNNVTWTSGYQQARPYYKQSGVFYTIGTKPALNAPGAHFGVFNSGVNMRTSHSIYQLNGLLAANYILAGTGKGLFAGGTSGAVNGPGLFDGVNVIVTSNSFEQLNTPYFLSTFSDPATSIYINNTLFSSVSGFQLTALNTLFDRPDVQVIGLNGRFCELITYSTNEVAAQSAMRQNINTFYGIYP